MLASALCTTLSMETKSPRSALSPCSGIQMSLMNAIADLVLLLRASSLTPGSLTVSFLRFTSLSIDYIDLAAGVNLYYYNGDYYLAGHYYLGTTLSFRCSDSTTIPKYADVERLSVYNHIIWMDSVYACPKGMFQNLFCITRSISSHAYVLECFPNSQGQICSGHGICMNDNSIDASRCFCNSGFKGEDCSKSVGLSMTDYVLLVDIAMVVVIVFTMYVNEIALLLECASNWIVFSWVASFVRFVSTPMLLSPWIPDSTSWAPSLTLFKCFNRFEGDAAANPYTLFFCLLTWSTKLIYYESNSFPVPQTVGCFPSLRCPAHFADALFRHR